MSSKSCTPCTCRDCSMASTMACSMECMAHCVWKPIRTRSSTGFSRGLEAMQMQGLANGKGRLATTAAPFMKALQHGVGSKKMARFPRAFLQTWRLAIKLGIRKGFASSYCLVFFPHETLTSKQKSGKLPGILSVVKCCSCRFCNLGAEPFVESEDGG